MKIFLKFIFLVLLVFSLFNVSNAFNLGSIFSDWTPEIPYCNDNDCWIDKWIDAVSWVNGLVIWTKASVYFQSVVKYILGFIYLIAIFLITYAWFNTLTWAWDEEKAKKSKTMIIYVIVWITIIFLAGPIVNFVLDILTKSSSV